jgi:exonuclease III
LSARDLADRVKSCYVLNNEVVRGLSDHIPVVVEINV